MKTAFGLGALALASAFETEPVNLEQMQFLNYVSKWGKSYGTHEEYQFRFQQWKKANDYILQRNQKENKSFEVEHNRFSDMTASEKKVMLGYKPSPLKSLKKPTILDDTNLANSVDWRDQGAVTPIRNQGQCGSCWAFSTVGAIEGAYYLSANYLEYFTEQQLVDCDKVDRGCEGGLMDQGFQYVEQNSLMLRADYAYTAKDGTCKYDTSYQGGSGKLHGFHDVQAGSVDQLKAALNKQPVSVGIEADSPSFTQYKSGIIDAGADCGDQLDHGVLAVGYGTENGQDYFLVKNSWGTEWGMEGYVKIGVNQCGITKNPSYPSFH